MENPPGHSITCAESHAPKSDCTCRCNTTLHGILLRPDHSEFSTPPEASTFRKNGPRKKKKALATAAVLTITGTLGGLTATGTFSSPADASSVLSVQASVDVNKVLASLSELGFGGKILSSAGTSGVSDGNPSNCADSASGQVKAFLTRYPCELYAAETWSAARQGYATDVAFSWVEMPSTDLANRYKALVDKFNTGNPPGVSLTFNGRCYASGQQGATVWTVEIKPTGNVNVDQTILQAAAQENLPATYLGKHCDA
jgi:hypothetical protein